MPPMGPKQRKGPPLDHVAHANSDLVAQCSERWRNATLDHFSRAATELNVTTFQQRYFFCDKHWRRGPTANSVKGPIFFYVGNEADVTLYLNATGLMWENAAEFGALLVFAEHRYYGRSKPYGAKHVREHMGYLSAEQALADYAELITELKIQYNAQDSPVIGFGGSYGGMLGSWMRIKYPHILDGVIAGSAPIWNFFGEDPPFDPLSFAKGVTYDATPEAGSAAACVPNARAAWRTLVDLGRSQAGRDKVAAAVRLCDDQVLDSTDKVTALREWMSSAWDSMAMGNYPYPSSYILNGGGLLPTFPVRVACSYLAEPSLKGTELLEAMTEAIGVFYNYSHDAECFRFDAGPNPESDEAGDFWGYQWCTEMFMPASRDGVHDMFWDEPFNETEARRGCKDTWGVTPRRLWAQIEWGGRRIESASNIVFSNGLYDPWHGGGVLENVSDTVVSLTIPTGAHHLDLMFSHPDDPQSVKDVRKQELHHITRWVEQAYARARKNGQLYEQ